MQKTIPYNLRWWLVIQLYDKYAIHCVFLTNQQLLDFTNLTLDHSNLFSHIKAHSRYPLIWPSKLQYPEITIKRAVIACPSLPISAHLWPSLAVYDRGSSDAEASVSCLAFVQRWAAQGHTPARDIGVPLAPAGCGRGEGVSVGRFGLGLAEEVDLDKKSRQEN